MWRDGDTIGRLPMAADRLVNVLLNWLAERQQSLLRLTTGAMIMIITW